MDPDGGAVDALCPIVRPPMFRSARGWLGETTPGSHPQPSPIGPFSGRSRAPTPAGTNRPTSGCGLPPAAGTNTSFFVSGAGLPPATGPVGLFRAERGAPFQAFATGIPGFFAPFRSLHGGIPPEARRFLPQRNVCTAQKLLDSRLNESKNRHTARLIGGLGCANNRWHLLSCRP